MKVGDSINEVAEAFGQDKWAVVGSVSRRCEGSGAVNIPNDIAKELIFLRSSLI